ncbi:MAG: hypothetical protein IJ862_02355 [Selenomonadaceae bacterium]|nr:hypothetical protein [Selenomonadaceae bacterium]
MSRFIKKVIDIALLILFLSGLASMFIPANVHEVLGCTFILLVIIHNIVNRNFYRSIPNGKLTKSKLVNCVCLMLFSLSLGALMFSGIALSNYLFADLKIPDIINWRALHLASAIITLFVLFVHLLIYANRYIKNKAFRITAFVAFAIAVSSIFAMPYLDRWFHKVEVDSAQIVDGKKLNLNAKVMTIYFSRVGNTDFTPDVNAVSGASVMKDHGEIIGNTQMIAMMVNNTVGGKVFEIQTVDKYPASYSETVTIGKNELNSAGVPILKGPLPDLSSIDTVVLVYPLWWSTLPRAVEGFLRNCDLSGKTLIPIVTHGGGGVGDSLEVIRRSTNARFITNPLDIYSSDVPTARSTIYNYLDSLRLK